MKTVRDISGAERMSFRPELSTCPECGAPLQRRNIAWRKTIQRMDGLYMVTTWAHCCSDDRCPASGTRFRSSEAELLSLKWRTFGLDVIGEIGLRREERHETVAEIHRALVRDGVVISEREVYELLEVFYALLELRSPVDDDYRAEVERNGGVVLSIDGVKPEWANDTLYILMDTRTGRVLHAAILQSSANEDLVPLFENVKATGLPVLAVVSDHQLAIRLAVAKVFPDVVHQLCHYHVLRAASKPTVELDRNLKKRIKGRVRGIRPMERSIKRRREKGEDSVQLDLVAEVCDILRGLLKHKVPYPLKPGGLIFYDKLRELDATLQKCLERAPDDALARLQRITGRWREFEVDAARVRYLYGFVWKLAHILDAEYPSYQARMQLGRCISEIERAIKETDDDLVREALKEFVRVLRSHWWGLFSCYDDDRIPHSNNGLESFIGSKKQAYRRITGRQHWGRYIVRFGMGIVMGHDLDEMGEIMAVLEEVAPSSSAAVRERLERNRGPGRRLARIRASFDEMLVKFEAAWTEAC